MQAVVQSKGKVRSLTYSLVSGEWTTKLIASFNTYLVAEADRGISSQQP